jgi:hypothetical protein
MKQTFDFRMCLQFYVCIWKLSLIEGGCLLGCCAMCSGRYCLTFQRRQWAPLKCRSRFTSLHRAACKKTSISVLIAVGTWNFMLSLTDFDEISYLEILRSDSWLVNCSLCKAICYVVLNEKLRGHYEWFNYDQCRITNDSILMNESLGGHGRKLS